MQATILLLLGLARAGGPLCADASSTADLERAIEAVSAAFAARDAERLAAADAVAQETLSCLVEPLSPALAARWHAARALAATGAREVEVAHAELRAVSSLVEGSEVPAPLQSVPLLQSELRWLQGQPSAAARPVSAGGGATLLVDGQPEGRLSRDAAAVLQLQLPDETTWLTRPWEGDRAPWRWQGVFPADVGPEDRRRRVLLSGGAGALALGAGAVYAVGLVNVARFEDDPPRQEIPTLYARSHALTWVAAGAGLGAAGLGVTAALTW